MKLKFTLSCLINGLWLLHCLCHNPKVVSATTTISKFDHIISFIFIFSVAIPGIFTVILSESQSLVDIHGHIKSVLIPFKHTIHHVTHGNDQETFQSNYLVSKQLFFAFHTHYRARAKRDR